MPLIQGIELSHYSLFGSLNQSAINVKMIERRWLALSDASFYSRATAEPTDGEQKKAELKPMEYYEYELVGILIHRGTADNGHYYSFIKVHIPKI